MQIIVNSRQPVPAVQVRRSGVGSIAAQFKALLVLSLVLITSGCATLDRTECATGQWQEIGYYDGARGRGDEFLGLHEKACAKHGVSVEQPLYASGYQAGLADFCQPPTAYRLGRNEESYNYVCPTEFERDFVIAYAAGLTETMAELQIQENFLDSRLWYATVRNRNYQTSYEIAPGAQGSSGSDGRTVVLTEPRILDSLRYQIDNYRDRRGRIRNALARANRFLDVTTSVAAPVASASAGVTIPSLDTPVIESAGSEPAGPQD